MEKAKDERLKATEHFITNASQAPFVFKAYKLKCVAIALEELFHGKCAYCESRVKMVSPLDVEHFRPKSEIKVGNKVLRPGYYWLAAEWANLLLSCIMCNRPNRVELSDGSPVTAGKKNEFPLEDEAMRAHLQPHAISAEKPLLLDPCGSEDPRNHLIFHVNGDVSPRHGPDGVPSKRGEVTIAILALQRKALVQARRDHASRVAGELCHLAHHAAKPEDPDTKERLYVHLSALAALLEIHQPYLAMTMDIIDEEDPDLRGKMAMMLDYLSAYAPQRPAAKQGRSLIRSIMALRG